MQGYDVKKVGLASHYIESKNIDALMHLLSECKTEEDVNTAIENFSVDASSRIESTIPLIARTFDGDTVEEIYENLHLDGSDFALQTLNTLNRMCPSSLKICHRQLKLGTELSLRECLKMEQRITIQIFQHFGHNLIERIRAVIIEKNRDDKPHWDPISLQDVTTGMVDRIFTKLPEEMELKFERNLSKL